MPPSCHYTLVSNIHSCVVNNGLSFDVTVSHLVIVRRLEDHWLCIDQSKGRLTYKKGANTHARAHTLYIHIGTPLLIYQAPL